VVVAAWEASVGGAASVAVDAGNPWEATPGTTDCSEDAPGDNWANFSKAEGRDGATAEDNWANFSNADFCAFSNSTPMDVSDSLNNPGDISINNYKPEPL